MRSFVFTRSVEAAHRFAILKKERQVDVGASPGEIEHANSLVTNEVAALGNPHVSVGDQPAFFSVHGIDSFLSPK